MRVYLLAVLALTTAPLAAQAQQAPPQLSHRLIENFLQIPDTIWLAEAVGVALNSEGHIFILNRGDHPLLEFTPDGEFVRSLGEGSPKHALSRTGVQLPFRSGRVGLKPDLEM